jgi:crossover junction endodeoxyribonuclease RuvC
MLILGIDPGTATTGYGVLKIQKDGKYKAIEWGLIETNKNGSPGKRLLNIYKDLNTIFKKHSPDIMAIEKLFFARNAKTAIRVGQAQGVMLHCAANHHTKTVEYAPGTIKKIVAGNGRAGKKDIQKHVRKVLGAAVRSKPGKKTHFDNAADALAVAICHAYTVNGKKNKRG